MRTFNQTSAEAKNRLKVLHTILEQTTSVCAGENESEGLLREGYDVIIGGGYCEFEICGDAIDGVGVPGNTSKDALEKIERPGVTKEGKAGNDINEGGDS